MAKLEEVLVPDIGDLDNVDVVEVLVAAGDRVAKEDSLITLESDKASMDVPSPAAGRVQEIKVKVGDQIAQGAVILILESEESEASDSASAAESQPAPPAQVEPPAAAPTPEPASAPAPTPAPVAGPAALEPIDSREFTKAYASPAVRRYARELGVDLSRVRGSGRKGRILREDVQGFVKQALAAGPSAAGGLSIPEMPVIDFSRFGEIERQELTRVQRIAGPNLHRSWLHVVRVTQNDEADITDMEKFRKEHAPEAKAKGFNLTPLAFILKACVVTLREYPTVNSSLDPDGKSLILKKYFHLGVAVDTPEGLMVPVIRDVDCKSIFDLAQELAEVSAQARDRKLKLDQLQGASFTVSSLGGIGGGHFSPVVNAPEAAILGVARSRMQPVWNGNEFVPRLMLPVSLSYDHRVIDGALAVRFTTHLCGVLADLPRLLL